MQNKVKEFNEKRNANIKPMTVSERLLDISSEFGELAKEELKATNYGTKDFKVTDDFMLEFGDVLYSLLSLACETGIDAEYALDRVIKKYSDRLDNNKNMGSGR